VFHSSGQLYSHKRKHDKNESGEDADVSSPTNDVEPKDSSQDHFESLFPSVSHHIPSLPPPPITETYPTGTTLTSIDGLPVFKRKRGRPPKNQQEIRIPVSIPNPSPLMKMPATETKSSLKNSSLQRQQQQIQQQQVAHLLQNQQSNHSNNPFGLPLGLNPFGHNLSNLMNGSVPTSVAAHLPSSSGSMQEGLIPVPTLSLFPMLPQLLFNLPPGHPLYSLQNQLLQNQGLLGGPGGLQALIPGLIPTSPPHQSSSNNTSPALHHQHVGRSPMEQGIKHGNNSSVDGNNSDTNDGNNNSNERARSCSQSPMRSPSMMTSASLSAMLMKDPTGETVPEGYRRYRFNEDCGYDHCGYREHQTHFHCLRKACGYSFCDKTRFVQHTARHSKLDALMGEDFQQYRSNVRCDFLGCPYSGDQQQQNQAAKGSHFHCLKCDFVCTDTNRVSAHRKQHSKMDSINAAGFEKYTPSQECGVSDCIHGGKQTHYHCLKCHYTVLGLSQMSSHKYKHIQETCQE